MKAPKPQHNKRTTQNWAVLFLYSYKLLLGELVLAYAAQGAYPIFRDRLKSGAGLHAVIRIANSRIIHISANITYIFFHGFHLPFDFQVH